MTFVPKRGHFEKLIDEKMVGLGPPVEGLGGRTPRTRTGASDGAPRAWPESQRVRRVAVGTVGTGAMWGWSWPATPSRVAPPLQSWCVLVKLGDF